MENKQQTIKRFMEKVHKDPPPGECWYWQGSYSTDGYGEFVSNSLKLRAYVWSFRLFRETEVVPEGKILCHTCNNRWCVNPKHLYVGTRKTNAYDMVKAGRGRVKIPDEKVQEIIRRLEAGENYKHLAAEFGVAPGTILNYRYRRKYRKTSGMFSPKRESEPKKDETIYE